MKRWAALLLVLFGCRTLQTAFRPPSYVYKSLRVWDNGQPDQEALLSRAFDIINDESVSLGVPVGSWSADVEMQPPRFHCPGDDVNFYAGCQDLRNKSLFYVGYNVRVENSAFVFELGHLIWERARGSSGEHIVDGGSWVADVVTDSAFATWVAGVNAKISRAVTH